MLKNFPFMKQEQFSNIEQKAKKNKDGNVKNVFAWILKITFFGAVGMKN